MDGVGHLTFPNGGIDTPYLLRPVEDAEVQWQDSTLYQGIELVQPLDHLTIGVSREGAVVITIIEAQHKREFRDRGQFEPVFAVERVAPVPLLRLLIRCLAVW